MQICGVRVDEIAKVCEMIQDNLQVDFIDLNVRPLLLLDLSAGTVP